MAGIIKKPIQVSFRDLCGVANLGGVTNLAPVFSSGNQSVKVKEIIDRDSRENKVYHTNTSTLMFTDANANDVHTASFIPLSGGYLGHFSLGSVNQTANALKWTFKVADAAIDYLQAGQTLLQKYKITISDGHGGTAAKVVTVCIVGTNDAPEIQSFNGGGEDFPPFGAVTEDINPNAIGQLTDSGSFTFDDVDIKDTHTVFVAKNSSQLAGSGGTLSAAITDAATGAGNGTITWTYNVDNSLVQYLDGGEQAIETFTITVDDGHGGFDTQVVTVVINGADDPVTISGLDLAVPEVTVFEKNLSDGSDPDGPALTQAGSFNFTSVDGLASITINGVPVEVGATIDTPLGKLTISGYTTTTNANGEISGGTVNYSYLLEDNSLSHDPPGADAKVLDSFTVTVMDTGGSTDSAVIDINIVDDVPEAGANPVIHLCSLDDDDDDDENEEDDYAGAGLHKSISADQEFAGNGTDENDDSSSGLAVVTGTLAHNFGADRAGSIALTGVDLPAAGGFTQTGTGNVISVQQNGVDVFLIELTDPATGGYQITQLAALCHNGNDDNDDEEEGEYQSPGAIAHSHSDDEGNENAVSFNLHYTVTDGDGDIAFGSAVIAICCNHEDDEEESSDNSGGNDNAESYIANASVLIPDQSGDELLPFCDSNQQREMISLIGNEPPECSPLAEQSTYSPAYGTHTLENVVFI